MELQCITELQSSHQRLNHLYKNLNSNQRQLIESPLGTGQDTSTNSLLKFAPIAEIFQSDADKYKMELKKFQRLVTTVQQTVRKINQINNPPPMSQQSQASKQQKSENGVSQRKNPIIRNVHVNNDDDHKASYPISANNDSASSYRKNAPTKKPYFGQSAYSQSSSSTTPNNGLYGSSVSSGGVINNNFDDVDDEKQTFSQRKAPKKRQRKKPPMKPIHNNVIIASSNDYKIESEPIQNDNGALQPQIPAQTVTVQESDEHNFDTFQVGDSQQIHETNYEQYTVQNENSYERLEESKPVIPYSAIVKDKKKGYKPSYIYGGRGFDIFDGKEIFTSTMLRFSGIPNLREENENDKKSVIKVLIEEMNWNEKEIENIQIRNGRSWCIVYARCHIKVIKDRCKRQAKIASKRYMQNRENRQKSQNGEDELKQLPIYRISEYIRRIGNNNLSVDEEKAKLYILNFDVLNKNCHKALTNLFLKFGDLADDIQIGINSRNDPYAKVTYKNIEDAKMLWKYQNDNGEPKITFGKRQLTIQYAKY